MSNLMCSRKMFSLYPYYCIIRIKCHAKMLVIILSYTQSHHPEILSLIKEKRVGRTQE